MDLCRGQFSPVKASLAERVLVSFPKLSLLSRWRCGIPDCLSGILCELLQKLDILLYFVLLG